MEQVFAMNFEVDKVIFQYDLFTQKLYLDIWLIYRIISMLK